MTVEFLTNARGEDKTRDCPFWHLIIIYLSVRFSNGACRIEIKIATVDANQ